VAKSSQEILDFVGEWLGFENLFWANYCDTKAFSHWIA
jgi:hypothetical protein